MQNPNSPLATEYKVRPVVRYLITRYEPFWSPDPGCAGGNSSTKFCEVESEAAAEELARLLNEIEAIRLRHLDVARAVEAANYQVANSSKSPH